MRILELQAPYFASRWRSAHQVVTWGPHPHCDLQPTSLVTHLDDILRQLPLSWTPDVILLGDDSNPLLVLGLESAPCPTALLSVDSHHHTAWHAPLATAVDTVFVAQRDYLPAFEAAGASHARWLPLWAPDDLPPPAAEKTQAVAFIGRLDPRLHPERAPFMAAVAARLPLLAAEGPWAHVFGRSRIALNQTVRGDLNARVFEAMACGAMLLTERTGNGLLDLFTDGVELVTYPRGDVETVVATARHYLAADRERGEIAARGRARVLAEHLERHRAAEVLARLAGAQATRPHAVRHAGVARAYCVLAHDGARLCAITPGDTPFARLREVYLDAAALLARGPHLAEPDRSAVLGTVALERGALGEAVTQLGRAAAAGGRPEDHLARIEALLRVGDVPRARAAAEALGEAHPTYDLEGCWRVALGGVEGPA